MTAGAARALAVLALAAAAAAGWGCGLGGGGDGRPVILITLDTTRADRLGTYGGTAVPTPALDRLAREGVVFEQAVTQAPLTLPAHASLMTGRYPATLGVRHNGIYRLPEAEETLAERLAAAGYDTAAFVAAYVLNHGFGMEQGFATYNDVPVNRYRGGEDQLFLAERSADEVNREVFRWLDRRRGGPFLLWVHYYDPHDPYEPPERPGRELAGEGYDREISYVDACFGELMERLRADGLLDRGLVLVAADHGESLGEHGERTHGLFLYEGAVRVPLILRAPGLLPAGARIGGPVQLVDVAPTVLDLLGQPPLARAQGVSLRPRIDGGADAPPGAASDGATAFAESLMPRIEFGWSELWMIRDERFKYIDAPTPELYDLHDDPAESRNLTETQPERAARMAARLEQWLDASADPDAESAAGRTLTPEEEERLRSLGYLGGETYKDDPGDERAARGPDPKEMIGEVRALDEARDRLAAGRAAEALERVERILRDNPDNHQARTTQVLALIELDRLAPAEEQALAALAAAQADPRDSVVLTRKARGLLASVYHLRGKTAEAESQYRELIRSDPYQQPARVDLARLLLQDGRAAEAETLVDEVLERNPRNGMALALRFRLEGARGDRVAAVRTAERLAEERAGDAPTLVQAGLLLMAEGRAAPAVTCFEEAIAQAERPAAEWYGHLGTARLENGDLLGARQAFLAVARQLPRDPRAYYFLGNIALREGDEAGARAQFRRALELDPAFVAPLVSLARWLASRDREDEAVELLQSAVNRNPSDRSAEEELERLRGR